MDDIFIGGCYDVNPNTQGILPLNGGYALLFVRTANTTWIYQDLIYTDTTTLRHYQRMKINDRDWTQWNEYVVNSNIQWNWASGSELYTKVDTIVFDSYTYAKYCDLLNLCILNQDWYIKQGTQIGYNQIKIGNINEKYRPINDLYCETTIEGARVYINIKASNGDVLVSGNKEFTLSENHCIRENTIYNLI